MNYRLLYAHENSAYLKSTPSVRQEPYIPDPLAMRGIIRIHNLETERTLLFTSENLTIDIQKIRYDLDQGNFPCKALQDEYMELGLEIYTIETLLIAEKRESLDKLLLQGKEKLEELKVPFYTR